MSAIFPTQRGIGQQGALTVATDWVENLLLGEVGTVIAMLAVAGVGFALLQGRLSARDGIRVVLGCFVLFGAPAIANGIVELANRDASWAPARIAVPPPAAKAKITPLPPPMAAPAPSPRSQANPFDPYAGASEPN